MKIQPYDFVSTINLSHLAFLSSTIIIIVSINNYSLHWLSSDAEHEHNESIWNGNLVQLRSIKFESINTCGAYIISASIVQLCLFYRKHTRLCNHVSYTRKSRPSRHYFITYNIMFVFFFLLRSFLTIYVTNIFVYGIVAPALDPSVNIWMCANSPFLQS